MFAKCLRRMSRKRPTSRLNFSLCQRDTIWKRETAVHSDTGNELLRVLGEDFFSEYLRRAASGSPTSFGLTPWMVLVLTPMVDPRAGATKTSVENPPTPTDRRVSQIRFICHIVRGLSETWDPLDEEERRSFERWDRNRRISAKNVEVYRRAHPDHEQDTAFNR